MALCALANGREQPRFACLVRRFAAAEASKRNRLKRLFREAFRKNQLIFLVGIDIAVVVSKVPEKISFVNVENIYLNLCILIELQLASLLE